MQPGDPQGGVLGEVVVGQESGPVGAAECMQQALGQAEAASAHRAWPWGPAAMSVVRAAALSPSMLWKQLPGPVF